MVKLRELVNSAILNSGEEWLGFLGDSEYINDKGELVMGMWAFLHIYNDNDLRYPKSNYLNLDKDYDEEVIRSIIDGDGLCAVLNDNGKLCRIRLFYHVSNMPSIMNGNVYVE